MNIDTLAPTLLIYALLLLAAIISATFVAYFKFRSYKRRSIELMDELSDLIDQLNEENHILKIAELRLGAYRMIDSALQSEDFEAAKEHRELYISLVELFNTNVRPVE